MGLLERRGHRHRLRVTKALIERPGIHPARLTLLGMKKHSNE